jgi:hypothetical protein
MNRSQNFASIENESAYSSGALLNGRIDLISKMPTFNIPEYQKKPSNNDNYKNEALYQLTNTEVSNLFFSSININALQDGIRYRIYNETNGKFVIGKQSEQELKVVMRSIYLQYANNDNGNCVEEVKRLNALVLNWTVPEVLSNLLQHQTYRKDASTLPIPLELPELLTKKGSRQGEFVSFM